MWTKRDMHFINIIDIWRYSGRGEGKGGGMKERVRELGMERYTKEAERRWRQDMPEGYAVFKPIKYTVYKPLGYTVYINLWSIQFLNL